MLSKDDLIAALRLRFDHHSAEALFDAARARAGLGEQSGFQPGEVAQLRTELRRLGDRLDRVEARFDELLGTPPAPAAGVRVTSLETTTAADVAPAHEAPTPTQAIDALVDHAALAATAIDETVSQAADGFVARAPAPPAAPGIAIAETPPVVATTVVLSGVVAERGDTVLMCGGLPELGDWEPEHALAMTAAKKTWSATLHLATGAEIEFKFLRRGADGELVWESGGNRTLEPSPRIEVAWRQ